MVRHLREALQEAIEDTALPFPDAVYWAYHFDTLGQTLSVDVGGTGSGKTEWMIRLVRQALEDSDDARILIAVPTHDLARELVNRLRTTGIESVDTWLGWDQKDPLTGDPYCRFSDTAKLVRDAGSDPKRLCTTCPYAAGCLLYQQRQKKNVPAVQVATHHILHHKMENRSAFDLVVIDEDAIGTLVTDERYAPAELLDPERVSIADLHTHARGRAMQTAADRQEYYPGLPGEDLDAIRQQLLDAFASALDQEGDAKGRVRADWLPRIEELKALRDTIFRMIERPDVQHLTKTSNAIFRQRKRLVSLVQRNGPLLKAVQMLDELLTVVCNRAEDDPYLPGVFVTKGETQVTHLRIAVVMPIHEDYRSEKMLLLSATAVPHLYEPLFETVYTFKTEPKPRPPHARVHLIPRSASKTSLFEDLSAEELQPTPLLRQLGALLIAKAREHKDEASGSFDGYVCAQQAVTAWLQEHVAKHTPELLDRLGFEHFNAVAGVDRYRQVRFGLVIGRPLPQLSDLRPLGEALARHSLTPGDGPFGFTPMEQGNSWQIVKVWREVGEHKFKTAEPTAENPYLDSLIRATCHAQVVQADRTRANRRAETDPVDLYVVGALDLHGTLSFDVVTPLKHMRSWYHQMADFGIVPDLSKKRGINPLVAAVLHDQFRDVRAVRERRTKDKTRHGIDESQWTGTEGWPRTQRAELLLPGQRYNSHVLVRADTPDDVPGVIKQLIEDGRLPEGIETKMVRVRAERSDKGTKRKAGGRRPTRTE